MKKDMLTLVVGILIGAVIATGVFLVLKSNDSNRMPDFNNIPSMNYGERPSDKNIKDKTKVEDNSETNKTEETN